MRVRVSTVRTIYLLNKRIEWMIGQTTHCDYVIDDDDAISDYVGFTLLNLFYNNRQIVL